MDLSPANSRLKCTELKLAAHSTVLCQDEHLVKVSRQPIHDNIEGIVEAEVIEDDGPYSTVTHHPSPRRGRGSALSLALVALP